MVKWVVVFDIDGVFTSGGFFYTKEGKVAKEFGADDFDAVREVMSSGASVHIVTADKKGFPISEKRFADEMGWNLDLVPNKPPSARWEWIKKQYPNHQVCYVGDGIYDWYCLSHCDYGITPADALPHVAAQADYVSKRTGGKRFVADACLKFLDKFAPDFSFRHIGEY